MKPSRILFVEDEPALAQIISDALRTDGYEVYHVDGGKKALSCFQTVNPDICILDVMLPEVDGFSIARQLRQKTTVPILFLSARVQVEDVVEGFKSGGDDYLKKPFSIDELLVRINYLLGRSAAKTTPDEINPTIYPFGNSTLDTVQQTLSTPAGIHKLSFKETALLEMLLLHQNKVLERSVALRIIWGDDSYYLTRSMDVFLSHLRKLLKDDPKVQLINIRGIGYKLVC